MDGRKEIAAELSRAAGVEVSVAQVRRYERRAVDPLPTRPLGRGARERRVAVLADVLAWCSREYGTSL